MQRHLLVKAGIAASIVILALVGVRFLIAPAIIAHPDRVHVVVSAAAEYPAQHMTVIFDHWSSQQATPLYTDLVVGGPLTGPSSCPVIFLSRPWYHYELTFSRWGMTTATATSDTFGCMYFGVQYPLGVTAGYSWYREDGPSFWEQLHQLVNAPMPIGTCVTIPGCD